MYLVNSIFYSLHGEGVRYGIPHVFVRFAQCNMACPFCDTEFESYERMDAGEILRFALKLTETPSPEHCLVEGALAHGPPTTSMGPCRNIIFCGGEPLLQLDTPLIKRCKDDGWFIAVETNGTMPAPEGIDWITCSPKVAEHAIKLEFANELKYVRSNGQGIPRPLCHADHYLISPLFQGDDADRDTIAWCVKLVKEHPQWRLTMQHHKTTFGGIL